MLFVGASLLRTSMIFYQQIKPQPIAVFQTAPCFLLH